jgi:hypothetical protein
MNFLARSSPLISKAKKAKEQKKHRRVKDGKYGNAKNLTEHELRRSEFFRSYNTRKTEDINGRFIYEVPSFLTLRQK